MKWPKTLMVVSHARDFLNMVCTDVLHLHSRKLTSYKGDFDTFERTANERLKNAKKAAEGHERQRAHMQVQTVMLPGTLVCLPFWGCFVTNLHTPEELQHGFWCHDNGRAFESFTAMQLCCGS